MEAIVPPGTPTSSVPAPVRQPVAATPLPPVTNTNAVAAGANADPGPSDHSHGGYSVDYGHDRDHRDWGYWGFWPWQHDWDHSFHGDHRGEHRS